MFSSLLGTEIKGQDSANPTLQTRSYVLSCRRMPGYSLRFLWLKVLLSEWKCVCVRVPANDTKTLHYSHRRGRYTGNSTLVWKMETQSTIAEVYLSVVKLLPVVSIEVQPRNRTPQYKTALIHPLLSMKHLFSQQPNLKVSDLLCLPIGLSVCLSLTHKHTHTRTSDAPQNTISTNSSYRIETLYKWSRFQK